MAAKSNTLLLLLIAGGLYFFTRGKGSGTASGNKRQQLITALQTEQYTSPENISNMTAIYNRMTDQEIVDTYTFTFDYVYRGLRVPPGSPLYYAITAISNKYNIFT